VEHGSLKEYDTIANCAGNPLGRRMLIELLAAEFFLSSVASGPKCLTKMDVIKAAGGDRFKLDNEVLA
jgi:hypothetical protein